MRVWSSGMILPSGGSGPEFDSPFAPIPQGATLVAFGCYSQNAISTALGMQASHRPDVTCDGTENVVCGNVLS
jgi:hypothetical protein